MSPQQSFQQVRPAVCPPTAQSLQMFKSPPRYSKGALRHAQRLVVTWGLPCKQNIQFTHFKSCAFFQPTLSALTLFVYILTWMHGLKTEIRHEGSSVVVHEVRKY